MQFDPFSGLIVVNVTKYKCYKCTESTAGRKTAETKREKEKLQVLTEEVQRYSSKQAGI